MPAIISMISARTSKASIDWMLFRIKYNIPPDPSIITNPAIVLFQCFMLRALHKRTTLLLKNNTAYPYWRT